MKKVRDRSRRAVAALESGRMRYAVVGGNAVAARVSRVDEAAVRNTQDVALLLRRADLAAAIEAMTRAGFVHRRVAGVEILLDGPEARARDAVHIVFATEKVRPDYPVPAPDVTDSEATGSFRLLTLDDLVRRKLTAFSDEDRTPLRDLIDVGLLEGSWVSRLPEELGARLRSLLDSPEG